MIYVYIISTIYIIDISDLKIYIKDPKNKHICRDTYT